MHKKREKAYQRAQDMFASRAFSVVRCYKYETSVHFGEMAHSDTFEWGRWGLGVDGSRFKTKEVEQLAGFELQFSVNKVTWWIRWFWTLTNLEKLESYLSLIDLIAHNQPSVFFLDEVGLIVLYQSFTLSSYRVFKRLQGQWKKTTT